MTADLKLLGETFAFRARHLVRVHSDGFHIGDATYPALRATLSSWTLVRKLFRDERLLCRSENGEVSTRGKECESCRDRPQCSPRLRVFLDAATVVPAGGGAPDGGGPEGLGALVLELNATSCRNFLAHAHRMAAADIEVPDLPVRLTVVDRGQWGEVCFTPDPGAPPDTL